MLVSVVLAAHNAERTVEDAVRDVLAQTYGDLELIVVDDGSTDSTASVLEEISDDRLRIERFELNRGLTEALRAGTAAASGVLIARMDADDRCAPDRIERCVERFRSNSRLGLLGTAARLWDEATGDVRSHVPAASNRKLQSRLMFGNRFIHGSTMFRSELLQAVGGYRSGFRTAQDYDLWLRLAEVSEVENLLAPLYTLRLHKESVSVRRGPLQKQDVRRCLNAAVARRKGQTDELGDRLELMEARLRLGPRRLLKHHALWALGLTRAGKVADASAVAARGAQVLIGSS